MIGFKRCEARKPQTVSANPLLDVNKGWLQKVREDAGS